MGFPDTPRTMLAKMAADTDGISESDWTKLFDLYQPAVRAYAESVGAKMDSDDVAQEVFVKLVEVVRSGSYKPEKGRFRSYLATMIRNVVINNFHKSEVREAGQRIYNDVEQAVPPETVAILDAKWRLALRRAAVEHVLTRTALAAKSKDIFRAYVIDERPIDEVAAKFGVSRNLVSQIKTRVERMIADYESLFNE